jgi:hypothetical protein
MNLSNRDVRKWFYFLTIALVMWSCSSHDFNEYPPSVYLSSDQQMALLDKFIYTQYQRDFIIDQQNAEALHEMYKLSYYIRMKNKDYFMISYKGNFFSSGLICYGGEINTRSKDTTFNIHFTGEIPTHFTEDSVKFVFKKMLENNFDSEIQKP